MRIVVLTRGGPYPRLLLKKLRERRVDVIAVMVHTQASLDECSGGAAGLRRIARLPETLLRSAVRRLRARRRNDSRALGKRTLFVTALNHESTRRRLIALQPDLLVVAGCGILHPALFSVARVASINGHPGLLPWARGSDVITNALLRGVAIGATCHFIDAGIDTGPVIQRRLLRPSGTEATVRELEAAAGRLTAELVADVVADWAAGYEPQPFAQAERLPLCARSSPEERRQMDLAVSDGLARKLFEEWELHCSNPQHLVLDSTVGLDVAHGHRVARPRRTK
jgi:methionyl-tRNA formyltransferase